MTKQQLEQQLDSLFQPWQTPLGPGAQVLIRQHGADLYEKNFGYANLEHQVPIDSRTLFHVASISKQFTVLSVLLLWKDGLVDIDADIRTYVPELIQFSEPVTVRQLMNNVSGLRDQWELLFMRGIKITDSINMEDVSASLKLQKRLNFQPQSAYLYSNMGFHLLALIAEKASGLSLPEFAGKRIFQPLGMEHTMIRSSFTEIIPRLAYSYQDEGNGMYYYQPLNYSLYGPTSVNTCARDLAKMLDEYITPTVIDEEIIALIKSPAVLSDGTVSEYCGGLMTHQLHGMTVYEHGGADAAYRGHVLCIPEKKLEIILLSNTNSILMSKLAHKIACSVLDLEDCTEPELPSGDFSAPQEGVFLTSLPDDPQFVTIQKSGDESYMQREFGRVRLIPVENNGYRIGTLDEILFFQGEQLFYRLPSRILHLTKASPFNASPLISGHYTQEETAMDFSIQSTAQGYVISMLRYGSALLYGKEDGTAAFSFGPDFTMYLRQEGPDLILDGYRVKNLVCHKTGGC